ncbi:MAG TPA: phosphatase PAP2 family protein [Gemmatirosa sp.]
MPRSTSHRSRAALTAALTHPWTGAAATALCLIAPSRTLAAQPVATATAPDTGVLHLRRIATTAWKPGVVLGAAAVALVPADDWIVREVRTPAHVASRAWQVPMATFDWVGAAGAQGAGPALLVVGALARNRDVADAGVATVGAYAVATGVTDVVKELVRRGRPYWPGWSSATAFRFGRGYPDDEAHSSFPSGHAAGTFAVVSALSLETRDWQSPWATPVRTLLWVAAVGDGASRVYRDTHWASDVVAGAAVGVFSGRVASGLWHAYRRERTRTAHERAASAASVATPVAAPAPTTPPDQATWQFRITPTRSRGPLIGVSRAF